MPPDSARMVELAPFLFRERGSPFFDGVGVLDAQSGCGRRSLAVLRPPDALSSSRRAHPEASGDLAFGHPKSREFIELIHPRRHRLPAAAWRPDVASS